MAPTLITNANIITAVDQYIADILIVDGRIHTIGTSLPRNPDMSVQDASGLLVFPGGVDPHTHLDWDFGSARTVDTFDKSSSLWRNYNRCRLQQSNARPRPSSRLSRLATSR
jgi:dihydropyrimidinase